MYRYKAIGSAAAVAAIALVAALADGPPGTAHNAQQTAPIQLGASGGNMNDASSGFCCGGTLGSAIKMTVGGVTEQYILSNNHILARTNLGVAGESIIHRARIDTVPVCSLTGTLNVGTLSFFKPINFAGVNNLVDAAAARVAAGMVSSTGAILDVRAVSSAIASPALKLAVQKSGRTTGLTQGTISAVNVTVDVNYNVTCGVGTQTARFINQFRIGAAGFSAGGDSGSLVVTKPKSKMTKPNPVGLLFAGSSTATYANPISAVLGALGNASTFGTATATYAELASASETHRPDEAVEAASKVKNRYETLLSNLPEAVGHGIALSRGDSGRPLIQLYVKRVTEAVKRATPAALEGVPVEVEETGEIFATPACVAR